MTYFVTMVGVLSFTANSGIKPIPKYSHPKRDNMTTRYKHDKNPSLIPKICATIPQMLAFAGAGTPFVGGNTIMPGGTRSGTNRKLKVYILQKTTRLEGLKYPKLELIHPA
jgi:hypothetical protein